MAPSTVGGGLVFLNDKASVRREPKGVILIIGPWNYPVRFSLNLTLGYKLRHYNTRLKVY